MHKAKKWMGGRDRWGVAIERGIDERDRGKDRGKDRRRDKSKG